MDRNLLGGSTVLMLLSLLGEGTGTAMKSYGNWPRAARTCFA